MGTTKPCHSMDSLWIGESEKKPQEVSSTISMGWRIRAEPLKTPLEQKAAKVTMRYTFLLCRVNNKQIISYPWQRPKLSVPCQTSCQCHLLSAQGLFLLMKCDPASVTLLNDLLVIIDFLLWFSQGCWMGQIEGILSVELHQFSWGQGAQMQVVHVWSKAPERNEMEHHTRSLLKSKLLITWQRDTLDTIVLEILCGGFCKLQGSQNETFQDFVAL